MSRHLALKRSGCYEQFVEIFDLMCYIDIVLRRSIAGAASAINASRRLPQHAS
jgi:hypothetical protein